MNEQTSIKTDSLKKLNNREEALAKFLGGEYWASIKIPNKNKRKRVLIDIGELDVRKSLGYRFEFSFVSDYNSLMPAMNKIQKLGYSIIIENDIVKIVKKSLEESRVILSSTAPNGLIGLPTLFNVFYRFAVWYDERQDKKK